MNSLAARFTTRKKLCDLYLRAKRNIHTIQNAVDTEHFDVVIVGGGPAGLALASALGALCWKLSLYTNYKDSS